MPELPDAALYVEHLTRRLAGRTLERPRRLAALSRLLRDDWPRTIEELEEAKAARRTP